MTQRVEPAGRPSPAGVLVPRRPATTAAPTYTAPHISLRQNLTGWAFVAPFVLIFLVFMAGPIVASALLFALVVFGIDRSLLRDALQIIPKRSAVGSP